VVILNRYILSPLALVAFIVGCNSARSLSKTAQPDAVRQRIEGHLTRDLRVLFRSKDDISALERRRLCSIEPVGIVTRRREVTVGDGMTLDKVIRLLFGGGYDGQVKVVSRNSIVQTPLTDYRPTELANIEVRPGDLVFIEGRE